MVLTLHLNEYVPPGACYHVARVTFKGSGATTTPHRHDFPEVFWVEDGEGVHLVNDEPTPLAAGDLVLVRPADIHVLRPARSGKVTIVNVAFGSDTLAFLHDRYFTTGGWPWQGAGLPTRYWLDRLKLERLGQLGAGLVAGPPSRLVLERFLIELLTEVTKPDVQLHVPHWLADALRRLADDQEALTLGVAGLASLAGRSREHVNRVLRAETGRTATETVNQIRLSLAARDLRMTDRSIAQVAARYGLPNVSYFYRLFRERFATTPRQYRRAHQVLVRGVREAGTSVRRD